MKLKLGPLGAHNLIGGLIEKNRHLLIYYRIYFIGLALRGDFDSGSLSFKEEPIENDGILRATLSYGLKMASLGNSYWMFIRERCRHNAQYLSPKIHNEIIYTCNKLKLERIVKIMYLSKGFYETADIGGIEQFSICAR